jgi:hypothetical protein
VEICNSASMVARDDSIIDDVSSGTSTTNEVVEYVSFIFHWSADNDPDLIWLRIAHGPNGKIGGRAVVGFWSIHSRVCSFEGSDIRS